ncbi:MAG: hypothetical protein AB7P52_05490 [Alphaproteobacteria bacterium]
MPPAAAAGPSRAGEPAARLNALTEGYRYSGHEFETETVRRIAFEPSLGLLAIDVDDVDETAPLTALIPLRDIVVVRETRYGVDATAHGVLSICKGDRACIVVTVDSIEEALQKRRAAPDAGPSGRERKSFGFGCRPEHCDDIRAAVTELIALASAPATAAVPEEEAKPDRPTPFQRAMAAMLGPVNQRLDREAAPAAGLPATRGVAVTAEGAIALLARECGAGAGCLSVPDESDVIVRFAAGDIDGNSIGYQAAGGGYAVVFSCAAAAGACIASPDGRLQFRGYGLPCVDQTECNRLVIDFASLLGQAVAWAN